ncbi:outer membrane protein assembly factor BamD [Rhodovarius crocodyli]|uniref:Outer membrane protein assembly factor BamD n=1 Tax=Rhodovarius crocodyli TaxID=1979269 RepID=A0A437MII2_9PROT|nr:outer membrane protein assembly factor BamD [Rhodovarius crocodyli]RVT97449.1 outer membrane protein assembly factor BamD [Rhodovarius crocodyli]
MSRILPVLALAILLPGCGLTSWDGNSRSLFGSGRNNAALMDRSPEGIYAAGIDALQAQRYREAVELFDQLERDHPFSTWATNAKIMGAYGEYMRNRYTEAIGALDRFIQLHPAHRDIAYAYYLRALCLYEQINDSQRDQRTTEQAIAALQDVANRFPDTAYARDARLKIDLGRDHQAGHEMNIGRYYQRQRLYNAAIGRYRRVIENYQTTNHVPEALHRLTEIYLALGLTEEARRTASVLGHNFPGNAWYQDSYGLLVEGAPRGPDSPGFFARNLGSIF